MEIGSVGPEDVALHAARKPVLNHSGRPFEAPLSRPLPTKASSAPERLIQHIPVEMALLALCGLPLSELFVASEHAARQGVSLDEYVLAEGMVSAEMFYAALARHLRRPFVSGQIKSGQIKSCNVKFANRQVPRLQIATGVALIEEGTQDFRYLVAPTGRSLRALLQDRSHRLTEIGITTPAHFRALVRDSARYKILDDASLGLWHKDKRLSAFGGIGGGQFLVLATCAFLLSFFGALDIEAAFDALGLIVGALILAFVLLRLVATGASPPPGQKPADPSAIPDFALPRYTLVLALYREVAIARKLHAALEALDYPRAKLDIILVLEEDDPATFAAFAELGLSCRFDVLVAPNGQPRTKPRALNVAMPFVRGDLVCVYDAEDEPDPDQLRKAAARFAHGPAEMACLQARLVIENRYDSLLAHFFAIEYAALFDVINPGLAALGLAFPLGGTSNHFRTAILREVGGWDAWNVTEDADLSFRLARAGYRVGMIESTTLEEAPITFPAWIAQRRRWLKGWMQTLIVHSRNPLRLVADMGFGPAALLLLTLFGTVFSALTAPLVVAFLIKLALAEPSNEAETFGGTNSLVFCATVGGLGILSAFWAAILGVTRRRWFSSLGWLPLLPIYYCLVSAAAWLALYELIARPYFWSKTEHGKMRRKVKPGL